METKHSQVADAITWGGGLIIIGVILLLNSLGIANFNFWSFLSQFWPLLLVIGGLNIIFNNSRAGSIFAGVFGIFAILAAVIYTLISGGAQPNIPGITPPPAQVSTYETVIAEQEYEDLQERSMEINNHHNELVIQDEGWQDFLRTELQQVGEAEPAIEQSREDDLLSIKFETPDEQFARDLRHKLFIGKPSLKTSVDFKQNSGNAKLIFDELSMESIILGINSGEVELHLTEQSVPDDKLALNHNSGNAVINIKGDVGIKVNYKVNSGNLSIDGVEISGKGVFTSDNYASADAKLDVELNLNSGNVEINLENEDVEQS